MLFFSIPFMLQDWVSNSNLNVFFVICKGMHNYQMVRDNHRLEKSFSFISWWFSLWAAAAPCSATRWLDSSTFSPRILYYKRKIFCFNEVRFFSQVSNTTNCKHRGLWGENSFKLWKCSPFAKSRIPSLSSLWLWEKNNTCSICYRLSE